MPIIDGAKMACEPCIRGHRSTKCNHANERIMIPVRKPGRPLSVCPHPTSNECSCSTVTAALPRTKKCACRPKSTAHNNTKQQKAQLRRSGYNTPISPLFAASPHAVARPPDGSAQPIWLNNGSDDAQMAGDHPGNRYVLNGAGFPLGYSIQNGQAAFPLKDAPLPFGFATPGPTKGPELYQADTNAAGLGAYYDTLDQKPNFDGLAFGMESVGPAAAQLHHLQNLQMLEAHGGGPVLGIPHSLPTAAPTPIPDAAPRPMPPPPAGAAAAEAPTRSCCGHRPQPAAADGSPRHTPTSSTNSLVSAGAASLVSNSAASSSSSLAGPALFADLLPQQQNNGAPAWPCYPADLGTVSAPLQQQSPWPMRLTAGAPPAPHMMPAIDLSAFAASMPMNNAPALQSELAVATATAPEADPQALLCECGDGCECVGCVVHPYNEATRNTIHAAWSSMMLVAPASTINASVTSSGAEAPLATVAATKAAAAAAANGATPSPTRPSLAPTPSDASGASSEEQTDLPPDDFLFVSYNFTGCEGESITCPCGDDCQCIGCTVHNNQPG